jgi:hypothetical protein
LPEELYSFFVEFHEFIAAMIHAQDALAVSSFYVVGDLIVNAGRTRIK